jgi:endonuclease G, mitochondrial
MLCKEDPVMDAKGIRSISLIVVAVALGLWGAGCQGAGASVAEVHCKHFLYGYPLGVPASNDLIVRDCYALSANDATKLADWVCYYLTAYEVEGTAELKRRWQNDPWLDTDETLEAKPGSQDDYRGAHAAQQYDRGHLAPLASFRGSRYAWQVNYYSNIVPQRSALNQGPWMRLEACERELVGAYGSVWVMTGPLYEWAMPLLPHCDEAHAVPSGFWKIVAVVEDDVLHAAAFIMDQDTARSAPVGAHVTTIDAIESRSGLEFFWQLPETEQATLEATADTAWVLTWAD